MPILHEVPAELRGRPFTRAEAIERGLTRAMLRGKRLRRIFTGVYVEDGIPDSGLLRFDAVRLIAPDCWAMCHTAAAIYGLPVPPEPLTHIGLPPGKTWPRDPRLRRHRHEDAPVVVRVDGRPVSCPTDVFLRLAGHLSLLDLVVVGDVLVRRRFTTPEELLRVSERAGGRWVRHARRAAALVRARVDSPKETELRLLLVLAGFPEPVTKVDVLDDAGGWIARADLMYKAFKIALEYDGRQHANDAKQWARDIRRRELLDAACWRTLVVTSRDLARFPSQTLTRVALVLHERHCQDVPALIPPDMSMYASPGSDPRYSSPARKGDSPSEASPGGKRAA
jgi:hypothetical protein